MKIKELFQSHPFGFSIVMSGQILQAVLTVAGTYALTWQFNAIKAHSFKQFVWLAVLQAGLLILAQISQLGSNYLWKVVVQRYLHQVRQEIVGHYVLDRDGHQSSEVQNRLINDLKLLENDYLNSLPQVAGNFALMLFIVTTLITFNWQLLVVSVLVVLLQIYLPRMLDKALRQATSKVSEKSKYYLKTLSQWLSGLIELRRYLAGNKLFSVASKASKQLEEANVEKEKVIQELDYLNQTAYALGDAILMIVTAILILRKLTPFGLIASIGDFDAYLFGSLMNLANYRGMIKGTQSLRHGIAHDREQIVVEQASGLIAPAAIKTKNLTVDFPNGVQVSYPDIEVKPMEKVILTGASGAGKSTLLKLILGELKPTAGKIFYMDEKEEIITPDLAKINYLAQQPILLPTSILDNITMFDVALEPKVPQIVKRVELINDLAKFPQGIATKIDFEKFNVSGGQRQKIVLARGEIHADKLFLIDEGTSALDQTATQKIIHNLLQQPATVIFIAHNLTPQLINLFDRRIDLSS